MSDKNEYIEMFLELRKSQEKFNYYFLGIIIGLLSLSIQTFDPKILYHSIYLMIITWMLLLVSFSAGFFYETQSLKFKKADLTKSSNKNLADQYLKTYQNFMVKAHKYQIFSFFLAIVVFALFKITNIYSLPILVECCIILIVIILGGLSSLVYNRIIAKIEKNN